MASSLVTTEEQKARLAVDMRRRRKGQGKGKCSPPTMPPSSRRGVWTRQALLAKIRKELLQLSLISPSLTLVFLKVQLPHHLGGSSSSFANETFLVAVSHQVRSVLRTRDFLARYRNNVLVVVLPRISLSGATVVAERVRVVVDEMGAVVAPTSFGMRAYTQVVVAQPQDTVQTLLSQAEWMLSMDKQDGTGPTALPRKRRDDVPALSKSC